MSTTSFRRWPAWLAAVAVLAIAVLTLSRFSRIGRAELAPAGSSAGADASRVAMHLDDAARSDSREIGTQRASSADETKKVAEGIPEVDTALAHVRGFVVDTEGGARAMLLVAGADHPDTALAWTAADGSFEVSAPVGACLCATGKGFATVLHHRIRTREESQVTILVAPSVDIGGGVLDSLSRPIDGARLWLDIDPASLGGGAVSFDAAQLLVHTTRSDEHGQFAFADIPGGPAIRLNVQHPDHAEVSIPVPAQSTADLVIRMDSGGASTNDLDGIVVHADGRPASGSYVRLGENNVTRAQEDGRFRLFLRADFGEADLLAYLPGYQPAILPSFGSRLPLESDPNPELRLVLGPPTLSIEGTVQSSDGRMLEGWIVSLSNGVEASLHKLPPDFVETLVEPSNANIRSNISGRFHLGGLRQANYVLRAQDPVSLACVESEPIAAGSKDVRIQVPNDLLWDSLWGKVVAHDGSPVSGVRLTVQVARRFSNGFANLSGRSVLSDDLGAFSFESVPRRSLILYCEGEGILTQIWPIAEDSDPARVSVSVLRKVRFRITRVSPEALHADTLRAFTETQLPGFVVLPGGYGGVEVALADVGKNVLTTGENVREIALYAEGKEIARRAVVLVGDRVTDWEL